MEDRFSPPFHSLAQSLVPRAPLRLAITSATRIPETICLPALLEQARLPAPLAAQTTSLALQLASTLRAQRTAASRDGLVQALLQEFSLSSQEGVALMCLAEALLRIPDAATRDALIRDKLSHGNWQAHLGHSTSVFVNAAAWGLMVTGRLVATHSEAGLSHVLTRLIGHGGEPIIRKAVDVAMRMLGEQFVCAETIEDALSRASQREQQGFRYSYDMLGEAAMTAADAQRYFEAYEHAIHAIGEASHGRGIYVGPGISIKLSALHPRYCRAQAPRVMAELYPRLRALAVLARQYDVGLNIDAEEADRLELSLDLLERLCQEPQLGGWGGIGFVVQAYQKRCPAVIEFLIDLARRSGHRLMVRLVKGAYWDTEIKRAQVDGLDGFPVFTRKAHTDIAYLACARRLLDASDAVYPQFATHNAHTVAAIYTMAGVEAPSDRYEFQCLHGMGEPLYEQVTRMSVSDDADAVALGRACRIYAPVGTHATLLAYLVRRLLENGANSSFVHRLADVNIPLEALVADPVEAVEQRHAQQGDLGASHAGIALPRNLASPARHNAAGLDLADEQTLAMLSECLVTSAGRPWKAEPILADDVEQERFCVEIRNPADHRDVVGTSTDATPEDVTHAIGHAEATGPHWQAMSPAERAAILNRAADELERDMPVLIGLIVREAGKTLPNAVGEVREAVDFLREYAAQVRDTFDNDTYHALGPVVCISPWNFPLAIFIGQVAAALAAGNTVLAKPAEQTPLIAAHAVRVLLAAGVPRGALQLLPGAGETIGAKLVDDARIRGVLFTGSTTVARHLQRALAQRLSPQGRPIPLIAETGGQNAMVVDSSALPEQVVADVLTSAFDSAGQRCSALRVLCLQDDIAQHVLDMLKGAMRELHVGMPDQLEVDIGPVIDASARAAIQEHIDTMRAQGRAVYQAVQAPEHGTFIAPTLIEIDGIHELSKEVFGPVLHVVRYARHALGTLLDQINATGYGLTFGVHSRIDETITQVTKHARAGNQYVNRNMIGAVVGVQPFGGEGLSGTGPKAGGPLTLLRLLAASPPDAVVRAVRRADTNHPGNTLATSNELALHTDHHAVWCAWLVWLSEAMPVLIPTAERFAVCTPVGLAITLPGPTGEHNRYTLVPRRAILCLADTLNDRLVQLAAVMAAQGHAVWPDIVETRELSQQLPDLIAQQVHLVPDWTQAAFDVVLAHGDEAQLRDIQMTLADRSGALASLHGYAPGATNIALEWLVRERSLSINTAAAGGNASLMTIE